MTLRVEIGYNKEHFDENNHRYQGPSGGSVQLKRERTALYEYLAELDAILVDALLHVAARIPDPDDLPDLKGDPAEENVAAADRRRLTRIGS